MLAHWDEVQGRRFEIGALRGTRTRLAAAADAPRLGLSRWQMRAGERAVPLHQHADEEEFFVVLAGSGLSVEGESAYEIAAGDAIFYAAGGPPHTVIAGDEGLDVLTFSSGSALGLTWLPRPNVMWAAPRWLPLDGPNPFAAEGALEPLVAPQPSPERPATIVRIGELDPDEEQRPGYLGTERNVGTATGSALSGLRQIVLRAGQMSCPPHHHSSEDELFVVLDGDGELQLYDNDAALVERHPLRAGSIVSRPAGSGIAHALVAGEADMTYLAYGHRLPNEIVYYPRSRKAWLGRVLVRVEPVSDYWDGEP